MIKRLKVNNEFKQVAILIEEARNRAFQNVNEELVRLYFEVGNIVSDKVASGRWGDNTVNELASFLQQKFSGFRGFTIRGLYRMKQFYEVYSSDEFVLPLTAQIHAWYNSNNRNSKVSAVPTQINDLKSQVVDSLLCKGKDTEVVEYSLARNISPAMIADYETRLIPKEILANKLHQLIEQLFKAGVEYTAGKQVCKNQNGK